MYIGRTVSLSVTAVLALLFLAGMAMAAERKMKLKVPEMVCASRGAAAVEAATSVEGVRSADDDLDNATLTVIFDDSKATVEKIKEALSKRGYPAEGEPVYVK